MLLAVFGLARLGLLVAHDPLLGYANQYDMLRISACTGLYPDLPEPQRFAATIEAPLERYALGERRGADCYAGSELLFAAPVAAWTRAFGDGAAGQRKVSLRTVGYVKLGVAAAMVAILAWQLWPFGLASIVHGTTVALVLGDPLVGLWFNTLYAEASILLGAYFLIGMVMVIGLRDSARTGHWIALAFGCLLLGLAKEQFFLLPLALLLAAMPALWPVSRRASFVMILVALIPVAALALSAIAKPGDVQQANRVNAYLGAVLPASQDEKATLARLGLPARCAALSGATWYLKRGEKIEDICPEVLRISSVAFLKLATSEPQTLADVVARILPATQNAYLGYLGVVAGERLAGVESLPVEAGTAWGAMAAGLPSLAYMALVAFAMLASVAAFFWVALASTRRAQGPRALPAYLVLLAIAMAYALGTTAFGDGFSEAARHQLLGTACLYAWLVAALILVLKTLGGEATAWQRVALVIALAAAGGAMLPLAKWVEGRRLAVGVVSDRSATASRPPEPRCRAGRSILSASPKSRPASATGTVAATIGQPSSDLQRVFPSYPESKRAAFVIDVPAEALATLPAEMRVEVKNAKGVVTEIDRRRLQPAPAATPAETPAPQVAK